MAVANPPQARRVGVSSPRVRGSESESPQDRSSSANRSRDQPATIGALTVGHVAVLYGQDPRVRDDECEEVSHPGEGCLLHSCCRHELATGLKVASGSGVGDYRGSEP